MTVLRYVKSLFRDEGQENVATPQDESAEFVLQLDALVVGHLRLRAGVWTFQYSDAFRAQVGVAGGVQPLVDFPDPAKTYESPDLWAFFMARIPSTSQPKVSEEIQTQGLDPKSAVQLLEHFGRKTIANPFVLLPAA